MTNRNARQSEIEECRTSRYIFLHELVSQTSDKIKIRSELLNILLAGRDTTASLLSNVWFELSKRPDVWSRLHREVIDSLPDGGFPTFETLKDMKYLRAVLNESLRLYPVVPENSRQLKSTPFYRSVVARTGNLPSSSPRASLCTGVSTPCIDAKTSMVKTPNLSFLSAGSIRAMRKA